MHTLLGIANNIGFHVGGWQDFHHGLKRCFAPPLCHRPLPSAPKSRRAGAALETREIASCPQRWSVASTNAVRHLLIQHEDNSTSRQFNKKQLNKIQLNYLPTEHIAIQQVLFQQHPSLNFRTTQQMQPPCSGKIRMSFQVQIWLANSKISCKIA